MKKLKKKKQWKSAYGIGIHKTVTHSSPVIPCPGDEEMGLYHGIYLNEIPVSETFFPVLENHFPHLLGL